MTCGRCAESVHNAASQKKGADQLHNRLRFEPPSPGIQKLLGGHFKTLMVYSFLLHTPTLVALVYTTLDTMTG